MLHHPFSGMVERYKRLKVSRRKGNHLKEVAVREGVVEQVRIPNRSGVVVLLDLSENGRTRLEGEFDEPPLPARRGSLVHEYWKHKIATDLRAKGLDVQVEAPLHTGGTVDILVQTEDGPRAIEVETGKSDAKANMEKCEKAGIPVTIVATDSNVQKKLSGLLKTERILLLKH
ncbi:MAG: hypothetical protein KC940_25350 [Candidatus Omnitrophica bacterium]|nr:hypothetical protein [Candidatus Omnitrophota bacterium]